MKANYDRPDRQVSLGRRAVLKGLGAAVAFAPLRALVGCSDASETTETTGSGGSGATSATTTTSGSSEAGWASGGTASMSGNYADPFTGRLGSACALTCSMTLGPCYAETIERKDISEGYPGLPVRLALLVVDETCTPVKDATVDIWHTRNSGLYSANDSAAMCTSNDADALSHRYFRGVQSTDASGRVDFDTCLPGWYPGRAVHIHFTVRVGGNEHVTSQLFFADDLEAELFASHPDYEAFGQPDTTNETDSIFGGDEYVLEAAKQADGALLAWKTLVIRSSLSDPLCNASG